MASKAMLASGGAVTLSRVPLPQLHRCFPAIDASVVTGINAPAGFGKTAALHQLREMFDATGRPVLSLTAGHDPRGSGADIVRRAARHLDRADRPVLIVDDAHLLLSDRLSGLAKLIGSTGDDTTIVIAARHRVDVPCSRWRAAGRVVDIDADRLRFAAAETVQLLAARTGGPVDVDWAHYVQEQSGGWPAGIALAAVAHRATGRWATMNVGPFTRDWQRLVDAFFAEEVLPSLDSTQLDTIQRLAILPTLAAGTASDILNEHALSTLETMAACGLFVVRATDGAGFAIDPTFRRMLSQRFMDREPAAFVAIHREVADRLATRNEPGAAIDVAQGSGDHDLLAATLERVAERMCYAGAVERVVALASAMDQETLCRSPSVLMCLAWWWMRALDVPVAGRLLREAEAAIDAVEIGTLRSLHEPAYLRLLLRHRQAMLFGARDDLVAAEAAADRLLRDLGDDHPYLSCTMLAQLMTARREFFHLPDALRMEADTRRATARAGSRFAAIALQTSVAPTLALQGRTATAKAMLEQAVDLATQFGGVQSGLSALPALPLAELCYDLGDIERADALVGQSLPAVRAFLHLDQLFPGHLVRARVLAAGGRIEEALRAIDEAHLVALECGLPRMRKLAMSAQVELFLRQGQPRRAEQAYRVIVPDIDVEPMPPMRPTRCQEAVALAWLRLQLRYAKPAIVRRVAQRWREVVWRANSLRSVVQFELILTQASALDGQLREARRHLRDALTIAAEPGWTRLFLDEGGIVTELLCATYRDGGPGDAPADRLAARLLGDIGEGHRDAVIEGTSDRLARREIEVLELVGNGLLNREVGERLGLTEGTVKWYMQQIYDKLGVRRRPQAVTRARLLGLIG